MTLLALLLGPEHSSHGTGLEWMPIASVVLAVVALVVILWYGSRNAV